MKKHAKVLIGLFVFGALLISCNKEKSFKKQLLGTWKTTSIVENWVQPDGTSEASTTSSIEMTFNEGGNGVIEWLDSGSELELPMTWTYVHSTSKLNVTWEFFESITYEYEVLSYEKNETLSLSLSHPYTDAGVVYTTLSGAYTLTKQ